MERMPLHLALEDRDRVLAAYLDRDGRLTHLPRKHRKRLVVLDHVSRVFEPGARYPESDVNALCRSFHDDVAMLRRALVDEQFLAREAGVYWRIGGTVTTGSAQPPDGTGSPTAYGVTARTDCTGTGP